MRSYVDQASASPRRTARCQSQEVTTKLGIILIAAQFIRRGILPCHSVEPNSVYTTRLCRGKSALSNTHVLGLPCGLLFQPSLLIAPNGISFCPRMLNASPTRILQAKFMVHSILQTIPPGHSPWEWTSSI